MEIYLDEGRYRITSDDSQIMMSERTKNKKQGDTQIRYGNVKYFTEPHWLFQHILRKQIFASEAQTFVNLQADTEKAIAHVSRVAKELDSKWGELRAERRRSRRSKKNAEAKE